MARVPNWQIGREMEYPYEARPPRRQIAFVFDTNKCIACQTCTVACKTEWTSGRGEETMFWNSVETKPYGCYPFGWDLQLCELLGPQRWNGERYEGATVFEETGPGERVRGYRPEEADYASPNLGEDEVAGTLERGAHLAGIHPVWMFYLARTCNHCTYPACLAACPRKAIYKREQDGVVLVDQSRCRGYQECIRACPYKKVFFNALSRVSEKCIGCFPLIERGQQPFCVQTCVGKIRLQGWLSPPDRARPENPMDYLVHVRQVALPLYPQAGTQPNGYYIPPVHVPRRFLHQLFGPGVERAIATYQSAKDDPQLLGALLLFGACAATIHTYRVEGEVAIGYDERGRELARVPFTEAFVVRDPYDERRRVYRHNTT